MSTPPDEYAREVDLVVDEGTETLSTRAAKTITEEKNRALLRQARRWRVSADVAALVHGTYGGRPASLIGLRFAFSYTPQSSNRLSSAEVGISFLADEDGGSSFPSVRDFAPKIIHADATEATVARDTRYSSSMSLSGGIPLSGGLSAEAGTSLTYKLDYRCEVVGQPWTSDEAYDEGCDVDNAVSWSINEHKLRKEGIPRELRTVVIVGRGQSTIRAKIKAKVKTSLGLSLFGSPWPPTAPLVIRDSVAIGDCSLAQDFKTLSKEQLAAFVGLDRPVGMVDGAVAEENVA